MANNVRFEDFSMEVEDALQAEVIAFLHEAAASLVDQTAANTPVGSGQLKGAWQYKVDEDKLEAVVGNPLENAIWTEFGTGEYALKGDGRKDGWIYRDEKTGKFHFTLGKQPVRSLHNAFTTLKNPIIRQAEKALGARFR